MKRIAVLAFVLLSCSGGDGSSTSQSSDWEVTIDGTSRTVSISSTKAETESDGGVLITVSGTLVGVDSFELTADLVGGSPVTLAAAAEGEEPTATLPVGGSSVNVRFVVGTTVYRGTSGTIVFTAYGTDEEDSIAGSFDMGLVGLSMNPKTSAEVSGSFSLTLALPAG